MGYTEDLEKRVNELQDKLAASELSYKTFKALITFVEQNSKVEWVGDRSERRMIVKSAFYVSQDDVSTAKDLPDAKFLFEKLEKKADQHEQEKTKF